MEKIRLTDYGESVLFKKEQRLIAEHTKAKEQVLAIEKEINYIQKVITCKHNLVLIGGIDAQETRCTICNYSWLD